MYVLKVKRHLLYKLCIRLKTLYDVRNSLNFFKWLFSAKFKLLSAVFLHCTVQSSNIRNAKDNENKSFYVQRKCLFPVVFSNVLNGFLYMYCA